MKVVPAIDLQDGKCVRLYRGDFARVTEYSKAPLDVAERFEQLQVDDLHVVDLDGARTGSQQHQDVIRQMCAHTPLCVQLGGGIRTTAAITQWLDGGVSRCVIGSLAVTDPGTVSRWLRSFGAERIVLALDVVMEAASPIVATHGWTRSSGKPLFECIDYYNAKGLLHVLCTDVSRDGAMAGPNTGLYEGILSRYPQLLLQASGGVRDIGDLERLRAIGVHAAITGKALLDGSITAAEVQSFLQSE